MALTLEEVMAEIDRIKEEYAREDPDNTAQAISTFMLENEVPEDLYRNAMSKVNEANYRGIAQSGLAGGETAGGDGTGVVKLKSNPFWRRSNLFGYSGSVHPCRCSSSWSSYDGPDPA
jgi:hypothetical protein